MVRIRLMQIQEPAITLSPPRELATRLKVVKHKMWYFVGCLERLNPQTFVRFRPCVGNTKTMSVLGTKGHLLGKLHKQ